MSRIIFKGFEKIDLRTNIGFCNFQSFLRVHWTELTMRNTIYNKNTKTEVQFFYLKTKK